MFVGLMDGPHKQFKLWACKDLNLKPLFGLVSSISYHSQLPRAGAHTHTHIASILAHCVQLVRALVWKFRHKLLKNIWNLLQDMLPINHTFVGLLGCNKWS
jgi:hypothetical protein